MHKLKEKIKNELMEHEEKAKKSRDGKLSPGELQVVHMLSDTLKNLYKIDALEGGQSEATDFMGEGKMYGHSYGRMGNPIYFRDDGMNYDGSSYDDGASYARRRDSMGRYSRDDGKSHMKEKLRAMMEDSDNDRDREAIRRCMSEIDRV
jgi:hypothetical protein